MSFVRKVAKERAESTVQRNDAKPDEIDMVREVLPDVPSCSTDVLPDVPVRESGLGKVDLIAVENMCRGLCKCLLILTIRPLRQLHQQLESCCELAAQP